LGKGQTIVRIACPCGRVVSLINNNTGQTYKMDKPGISTNESGKEEFTPILLILLEVGG